MTENETKEILAIHYEFLRESWKPYPDRKVLDALRIAISSIDKIQQYRTIGTVEQLKDMKQNYAEALSDWRQYRKIGTVEECREARERQRAKKPTFVLNFGDFESLFACECGKKITVRHDRGVMDNHDGPKFCSNCGRKWDWSDAP